MCGKKPWHTDFLVQKNSVFWKYFCWHLCAYGWIVCIYSAQIDEDVFLICMRFFMFQLGQICIACLWSFLTLRLSKPKVTLNEVSSKMTPLTSSICTRALVLLCQSWPPPRAPLSGGRSWKPSPVSGLHCWTIGKDKRLKTPSSKGTGQDYCRRCWLFYLLSSHWMCMCVCVDTCVCGEPIWSFKKNTEGNTARERRGQKMEGLKWWSDLKRGEIISNGIIHTHTLTPAALSPTLLNLHNTEQDIAAPCSLFTMWSQACWVNKS